MVKLPNVRESLDAVVAMLDRRVLGEAELVAVSDLTNPAAVDQKGVPWRAHVLKDYAVQKAAVRGGIFKPELALTPHWSIDILEGNDQEDDAYSVMTIIVPSKSHKHGFKAVGVIRPDVAHFKDGEPHVKLWFNALVDPQYWRNANRAYVTTTGTPTLADALIASAMERVKPLAGNDALVFSDDQCSLPVVELRNRGYEILLEHVAVSSLPEKRKSRFDTASAEVTLLVRPNRAYKAGIPLDKAGEMVKDYLVNGFEAPPNGKLVGQALEQLRAQTLKGVVNYR